MRGSGKQIQFLTSQYTTLAIHEVSKYIRIYRAKIQENGDFRRDHVMKLCWLVIPMIVTLIIRILSFFSIARIEQRKRAIYNTIIFLLLIASLYTDFRAVTSPTSLSNRPFHQLLQVDPWANSKHDLRAGFRTASLTLHPDKVKTGSDEAFIRLKEGRDVLSSRSKSWAYRRIGLGLVSDPEYAVCRSKEEYVQVAVSKILVRSGVQGMIGLVGMGRNSWMAFCWTLASTSAIAVFEVATLLSLSLPHMLKLWISGLLPFQIVMLMRKMVVSVSWALWSWAGKAAQKPELQRENLKAKIEMGNKITAEL